VRSARAAMISIAISASRGEGSAARRPRLSENKDQARPKKEVEPRIRIKRGQRKRLARARAASSRRFETSLAQFATSAEGLEGLAVGPGLDSELGLFLRSPRHRSSTNIRNGQMPVRQPSQGLSRSPPTAWRACSR